MSTLVSTAIPKKLSLFHSIYGSIIKTTPISMMTVILLCVLSQLALLTTLLLPWKLLMLLYSGTLPEGLPSSLARFELKIQVTILGMAILLSLIFHLFCELSASWVCKKGANSLLENHQKTGLFNNHKVHAYQLYSHLLQAQASAVFCLIVTGWLYFFYPNLLIVIMIYGIFWTGVWISLIKPFPSRQQRVEKLLPLLYKLWWHIGFICVLSWVAWDYWQERMPSLLILFISLILVRQGLLQSTQILHRLYMVNRQLPRARSLFLHNSSWQPAIHIEQSFHHLLDFSTRARWIQEILSKHDQPTKLPLEISCRLANAGNIAYLKVNVKNTQLTNTSSFILKIHNHSYETSAEHEVDILKVAKNYWPAPIIIEHQKVEQFQCILLRVEPTENWINSVERSKTLPDLRTKLMGCDLPKELIERYDRSHPHLLERLKNIPWPLLVSISENQKNERACIDIQSCWSVILEQLATLPRQLVLPGLGERLMSKTGSDDVLICDWSQWRWEPVGSSWTLSPDIENQLEIALKKAALHRPEMLDISPWQVQWATRLYEFERRLASKNYAGAINIVPGMLQAYNRGNEG
ncbi:hypothetical protein [Zobellella sp. DQSA1]|uniref:hypothetical protein n=1 Tax=Zobellella sp. DQSA1 TaxID=3342386 RepID=UPI0035C16A8D